MTSPVVYAHEVWLEPEQFQLNSDQMLRVKIKNGQNFNGFEMAWFDRRVEKFFWSQNGRLNPYQGRAGDMPAVQLAPGAPGLVVLAYQSTPSTLTYQEADKFLDFVRHKDLQGVAEQHIARGLPATGFEETYTRHVKAMIGVGGAQGVDQAHGLELEFIAKTNPYVATDRSVMAVDLLYQGRPRGHTQIEIFERAPDGTVQISTQRTNDQGHARIPVRAGHVYLLDAVVMRPLTPGADQSAVWQSLWAALSFAVP